MTKNKNDKIEKEIELLDKKVRIILLLGAPVLILIPILTTQFDWFFDFSGTGSIGDTIGGLTAPVIGVVSALLIYYSFRAQINANRIIQQQINDQRDEEKEKKEFNYQMEIYKHLKESIEQYSIEDKLYEPPKKLNGPYAIHKFIKLQKNDALNGKDKKNTDYLYIYGIIDLFEMILRSLSKSILFEYDIKLMLNLIRFQFRQQIWNFLSADISDCLNSKDYQNTTIEELYRKIQNINDELNEMIEFRNSTITTKNL